VVVGLGWWSVDGCVANTHEQSRNLMRKSPSALAICKIDTGMRRQMLTSKCSTWICTTLGYLHHIIFK
jgi:hypothetical protein